MRTVVAWCFLVVVKDKVYQHLTPNQFFYSNLPNGRHKSPVLWGFAQVMVLYLPTSLPAGESNRGPWGDATSCLSACLSPSLSLISALSPQYLPPPPLAIKPDLFVHKLGLHIGPLYCTYMHALAFRLYINIYIYM